MTAAALPVLPALVEGHVRHRRREPVPHNFRHPIHLWLVDLDAPPRLPRLLRPLARFRSADHLGEPSMRIKANVEQFLTQHGVHLGGGRIVMLANARVLGHVFDPLTVFWCHDATGRLACVVAEVHNTYGERHAYLVHPDAAGAAMVDKQLYVSPFFDTTGQYRLRFRLTRDRVFVSVKLIQSGDAVFDASLAGRPRPATTRALLRATLRRPLMPQRVSALIRLHGGWLWLRRVPIVPRARRGEPSVSARIAHTEGEST